MKWKMKRKRTNFVRKNRRNNTNGCLKAVEIVVPSVDSQ